jgi:hypothetical protein
LENRVAVERGYDHEVREHRLESLCLRNLGFDLRKRESAHVLVLRSSGVAREVRRLRRRVDPVLLLSTAAMSLDRRSPEAREEISRKVLELVLGLELGKLGRDERGHEEG